MGREMMIMVRFVTKDKLSKKAQKELNRQRRITWDFSPVTKTVGSKKLYNRKRNARDRYDDYGASAFLFQLKPILEGVSDSFTDNTVDVEGRIKDNGPQFAQINLPVSQDTLICLRGNNLANHIACYRIP